MIDRPICPDLETLAALASGSLEESRREEVLTHLDQCALCYETVTESVLIDEETLGTKPLSGEAYGKSAGWWSGGWLLRAAALFLVVLASWVLWRSQQSQEELAALREARRAWLLQEQELQRQVAEIRARLEPGPASESVVLSLLSPRSLLRSGGGPSSVPIKVDQGTQWLRLELEFDPTFAYPTYRAQLRSRDSGRILQTVEGLTARQTSRGKVAAVGVLATMLRETNYGLTLEGVTPDGQIVELAEYDFSLERN